MSVPHWGTPPVGPACCWPDPSVLNPTWLSASHSLFQVQVPPFLTLLALSSVFSPEFFPETMLGFDLPSFDSSGSSCPQPHLTGLWPLRWPCASSQAECPVKAAWRKADLGSMGLWDHLQRAASQAPVPTCPVAWGRLCRGHATLTQGRLVVEPYRRMHTVLSKCQMLLRDRTVLIFLRKAEGKQA